MAAERFSIGDPVVVVAEWSSLLGVRGHIVSVEPVLMAVLGDDPRPVSVGEREVVRDDSAQHVGGAE